MVKKFPSFFSRNLVKEENKINFRILIYTSAFMVCVSAPWNSMVPYALVGKVSVQSWIFHTSGSGLASLYVILSLCFLLCRSDDGILCSEFEFIFRWSSNRLPHPHLKFHFSIFLIYYFSLKKNVNISITCLHNS